MVHKEIETTKIRIGVDQGVTLEVDMPTTMTAAEWAGITTKLKVIKSFVGNNIMLASTKRSYHKWTDKENAFIKKHPRMSAEKVKKHLKLDLSADSIKKKMYLVAR